MTVTEILPYTGPPASSSMTAASLELSGPALALAQQIAGTDFVPAALRGKPAAVLAAILTGHELGIGPMQSLAKIHVIDGRPAMAAELMRALVLAAGHELWVEDSSVQKCTIACQRAGSERVSKFTWTMDDAKRAGLDGRKNWRNYPRAMLLARATGEAVRAVFPDVTAGISYTTEEVTDGEMFDVEDQTAAAAGGGGGLAPASGGRRRRAPRAATAPAAPKAVAAAGADEFEDFDETVGTAPVTVPAGGDQEGSGAPVPDPSPPPDNDEGGALPLASRVAMWCNDAGLDDEGRHRFLAALSKGEYSSAKDVKPADIGDLRAKLEDVKSGRLVLDEQDGKAIFRWSARDATPPTGVELLVDETGEPGGQQQAIELIDADYWSQRIEPIRGVGQTSLLRAARTLAEELGISVPSGVDEITDPQLVTAVQNWLDSKKAEQ